MRTMIIYSELNKQQKHQVIKFIRKMYNGCCIRDIVSGLHTALLEDNKLVGVSTNLGMIYNQNKYK